MRSRRVIASVGSDQQPIVEKLLSSLLLVDKFDGDCCKLWKWMPFVHLDNSSLIMAQIFVKSEHVCVLDEMQKEVNRLKLNDRVQVVPVEDLVSDDETTTPMIAVYCSFE